MQSYMVFSLLLKIENNDYNPYKRILCNGLLWESTSYGDSTKHTPGDTTRQQAFRIYEATDRVVGKGVERRTTFYERTNVIYFCYVIYYKSRGKEILSAAREPNMAKWEEKGFSEIYEAYDCGDIVRPMNISLYEQQKICHGQTSMP